jgi:ribosome biogenesis GTPase / thiamine phosphate phosphatase
VLEGIILKIISNLYYIKTQNGMYECSVKGKFRKDEIVPVVGDYVKIEIIQNEQSKGIISEVLNRKTYIKRPKIANITQLVLVVSTAMPKPDLLMLDKQLAFAEFLKIEPIIVLNKIDLKNEKEIIDTYTKIGYKVIKTNAKENIGVNELIKELKNNVSVFSGNSGVGKSTLINAILGEHITAEGKISDKNKKGKNTTTAICMYEIDEDTYIADTPGFSTFDIYEIEYRELANYFVEFKEHIPKCEFVGCTHIKEENCGVQNAIKSGIISTERYNRYIKIYSDLKEREEHKW